MADPPESPPADSLQPPAKQAKASGRLAGVGIAVFPGDGGRPVVAAVAPYTLARQVLTSPRHFRVLIPTLTLRNEVFNRCFGLADLYQGVADV